MTSIEIDLKNWECLRNEFDLHEEDEKSVINFILAHISQEKVIFEFRFMPCDDRFEVSSLITIVREYSIFKQKK